MSLEIYNFSPEIPRDCALQLRAEGREISVFPTPAGRFAAFGLEGAARLEIEIPDLDSLPVVRPLSRGVVAQRVGENRFSLEIDGPGAFYLEGLPGGDLMIFANPLETQKPSPDDPNVRFFAAGRVYDADEIRLESGQTAYFEGGAWVNGWVRSHGARDVRIAGFGVLSGQNYPMQSRRLLVFDGCKNVRISDFISVGTPAWNLVLGACEDVEIENVKLIGWWCSSDGIDICGSENVRISGSFFRNNDDCIAVKAIDFTRTKQGAHGYAPDRIEFSWAKNTRNVRVERCIFYNATAGNALEIGFETRCERISDVVFCDCDIIGAHGEGGVFTIHAGDRALIENIVWEKMRVEHFYDKFLDLRILHSRYSEDAARGQIRNVVLRDISTIKDQFNCLSLVGGFDSNHTVEGVKIENLVMGGEKIGSADQLNLWSKHASGISIE